MCLKIFQKGQKAFLDSKIKKIRQQNGFGVILESKKSFLDYKKQRVKKVKKSGFFQRSQSMVWVKNLKYSYVVVFFFARSASKMCLTLFQKVKKHFQTIKNRKFKKSKKSGFFQRGQSMVLVKNLKFSSSFYCWLNRPGKHFC